MLINEFERFWSFYLVISNFKPTHEIPAFVFILSKKRFTPVKSKNFAVQDQKAWQALQRHHSQRFKLHFFGSIPGLLSEIHVRWLSFDFSGSNSFTITKSLLSGDSLLSSLSQLSISIEVSMLLMVDSEPPPPAAPGKSGDNRPLLPPPPLAAPPPWPALPGLSAAGAAAWLGESGSEKEEVGDRRGK